MDRLTEWDECGNADIVALSTVMPEIYAELSFSEANVLRETLSWLGEYEDTGLTPREIVRMKKGAVMAIETFKRLLKRLDDQTVLWLWQEGSLSGELNTVLAKEAVRRKLIEKAAPPCGGN